MTTIETLFGLKYRVTETREQIAKLAAERHVLHLTKVNGQTVSINAKHVKL